MDGRTAGTDARGVSEFTGVAILITMTVLVTASVGMYVLVVDTTSDEGPPDANFSFQHISSTSSLIVTFDRGEPIAARNISFEGGGGSATWAELADMNGSEAVGPGAAVQLSNRNAYGQSIGRDTTIRVYYLGVNDTRARIDGWNTG
jgi:hypothetical protein